MNELEIKIARVMSDVFEVPIIEINEESSQDNVDAWDSIKHLNLVVALEEEFGITIPVEEVGNMISFKLISLIIKDLIRQALL